MKNSRFNRFAGILFSGLLAVVLLLLFSTNGFTQPPGMPGAPEQAPIDDGLSILAIGAGAYAFKKLRVTKK